MLSSLYLPMPAWGWRKSTYSGQNGDCVEVGRAAGRVVVRDTRDRDGPSVAFMPVVWRSFTEALKES